MTTTGWLLILTIGCAFALKTVPHRTSLRSALDAVKRKQNEWQMNSANYNGYMQNYKNHDYQNDGALEELLEDLGREDAQDELRDDGVSSNFRERSRANNLLQELATEYENYGIPRELPEDPRYEYVISSGESPDLKSYYDHSRDDNAGDYYNQEYYPISDRRNVNARYPIGRDFRNYRDIIKRFPVAKRSPKSMNKKRQVSDPKIAQDMATHFGAAATENHNNGHQTTLRQQNHTFGHDDTTTSISTMMSNQTKEKGTMQSMKSKEHVIDVHKKSIDWNQYFGIDRRKKKAVLAARPDSQNQDDAYFLQHYYSLMGDNLQTPKRNNDKELEEKISKLQQMDSRLKNIKDLFVLETILEGSMDTENSEELRDKISNKLATAFSLQKLRQALRDYRNNIIMQQQDNQYPDNYQESIDFDQNEDKHMGREGIHSRYKKSVSVPYMG